MADEKSEIRKPPQVAMSRGPGAAIGPAEKPKDLKHALKKLIRYMGKARYAVLLAMLFAAGGTLFQVLGPKVMGMATTVLAEGFMAKVNGTGGIDYDRIWQILMLTLTIYLAASFLNLIQAQIMAVVTQKIGYRMRRDIAEKINRMPMKYFESRPYGDVLSRITNDVDTFVQSLTQSVSMVIQSVTTVIGTIIMMLTISPLMTAIAMVILPVSGTMVSLLVRLSQKHFVTQQEYLGSLNGKVEESFSGQMVIKAFCREEETQKAFDADNDVLYSSAWKAQFISGLMQPVMFFVGNLGYVGVAVSGGFLAIKGVIGIGDIQAFIQYVKNFTQPLQQIAQVMNQVQSMSAAVERVFEFLEEEEEDESGAVKSEAARTLAGEEKQSGMEKLAGAASVAKSTVLNAAAKGQVTFDHVRFGYDPEKPVIHDFSADVQPGQKVAIVGPTGAGKTTIVKLLMRFYDVDAGAIRLDGIDIREYDRHALRENFGMVLQDTWLYSASIKDNIKYGRPDATDEEVEQAAEAAHIHHFIHSLPGGYDMKLNEEGTNVSAGQKQLITIARAILADNRVLILDEATSSVDTRTEELIQKAMDNLMKGRTSFVIAHRLSTIRNADLILVMDHGDIIEQGTHEELLAKGGFYAGMYNSQFDG
ncbi:MAG: ABC transporter ATP-binding protein [Eubacterium sp.]|nr:ABC transporter ATP-binding protein [Eubacterium sp.]